MSKVKYREDLDGLHCAYCGGDSDECLYLHSKCHIRSPTWTIYDPETGLLTVRCAECASEIAMIAVARRRSMEFVVTTEPIVIEDAIRLPPDGMRPYTPGDELDDGPDRWTRYNLCPICGGPVTIRCKCPHADSSCAQGHRWHMEQQEDKWVVCIGEWDHG